MSSQRTEQPLEKPAAHLPDPLLIEALAGLDATGERRMAQTARRRVMGKLLSAREQQVRKRHTVATAILASLGVLLLLSPAIWNSVENYVEGERLGGLTSQITLLILILIPALLAALLAGWRNGQEIRQGKRNS